MIYQKDVIIVLKDAQRIQFIYVNRQKQKGK